MSNNSLEIIHEGWLTKSPPSKPIWRARWRRRWFVLRHSGELPGQYFLEYYTDRNCRKLKGKIDLDQCEQVDAGLRFENRKQKYQHMFDVKTPKRIYYLAAESEEDMNKWVEYVCHVCGLKAYKEDEEEYDYGAGEEEPGAVCKTISTDQEAPILGQPSESPPVSPTSTSSGPYIPISECISGKSLSSPNGLEDFHNILRQGGYAVTTETRSWHRSQRISSQVPALPLKKQGEAQESPQFYDSPRKLHPPNLELQQISGAGSGTPPMQSPTTDGESVFTDDEWTNPVLPPSVNWKTFPNGASDGDIHPKRPSVSSAELDVGTSADLGSWSVEKRFGKLTVVDRPREGPIPVHDRQLSLPTNLQPVAPPRPPKPSHLLKSHNYLNLENVSSRPRGSNFRKTSVGSASSDSSKRTGNAVASNETVSASDGNEEPPSPLSPVTGVSDSAGISDEMYDFPRSHQYSVNPSSPSAFPGSSEGKTALANRHCYSNAAPGQLNGNVFCYDFPFIVQEEVFVNEEPVSPCSDGSSSLASSSNVALYSNLPSPQNATEGGPPAVNRCLKPDRKLSDSASVMSNEPSPVSPATHVYPPSVDRKLKPHRKFLDPAMSDQEQPLPLAAPPACRLGSENNRSLKKHRAAPSPTPPTTNTSAQCNGLRQRSEQNSSSDDDHRNSLDEQIYYFQYDNKFIPANFLDVPYVDLDFESDATANPTASSGSNMPGTQMPKSPERGPPATATVYLKVDFLKTKAFNKTKQRLEEERKKCSAADGL